jgi:hypothetical protein
MNNTDVKVLDLMAYRLKKQVDNSVDQHSQQIALTLQDMYINNEIDVTMEYGTMFYRLKGEEEWTDNSGPIIIDMCGEDEHNA